MTRNIIIIAIVALAWLGAGCAEEMLQPADHTELAGLTEYEYDAPKPGEIWEWKNDDPFDSLAIVFEILDVKKGFVQCKSLKSGNITSTRVLYFSLDTYRRIKSAEEPAYEVDWINRMYEQTYPKESARLLPSEIESQRFERRLKMMVCVITEPGVFKNQIQHCGLFIGWDFETEDPVCLCRSYAMEPGVYLSDTLEIPRAEIVEAYELERAE